LRHIIAVQPPLQPRHDGFAAAHLSAYQWVAQQFAVHVYLPPHFAQYRVGIRQPAAKTAHAEAGEYGDLAGQLFGCGDDGAVRGFEFDVGFHGFSCFRLPEINSHWSIYFHGARRGWQHAPRPC
jgi:hypothetical protein